MQSIAPFLMFVGAQHGRCAEAVQFYVTLFGGEIEAIDYHEPGGLEPAGTVRGVRFTINGQPHMAMDSGHPHAFDFTPAFSFFIECDDEDEQKRYNDALLDGGEALMPLDNYGFSTAFAWVKDRYGVSWQLNLP